MFECEYTRFVLWTKRINIWFKKEYSYMCLTLAIFFLNYLTRNLLKKNLEFAVINEKELNKLYPELLKLRKLYFEVLTQLDEHIEAVVISCNQESYEAITTLISNLSKTSFTQDWRDELERYI